MNMKNTRNVNRNESKKSSNGDQTVEVLYQKMGDRWFAFSLINDEVFVGSIPNSELEPAAKIQRKKRPLGNS
jgi:hypothetical protein